MNRFLYLFSFSDGVCSTYRYHPINQGNSLPQIIHHVGLIKSIVQILQGFGSIFVFSPSDSALKCKGAANISIDWREYKVIGPIALHAVRLREHCLLYMVACYKSGNNQWVNVVCFSELWRHGEPDSAHPPNIMPGWLLQIGYTKSELKNARYWKTIYRVSD